MAIGYRLKEERSRLGISQTDLAHVGGVGKTTQTVSYTHLTLPTID